MSFQVAEKLARALLYEGYSLYPYRASSLKNRQRWPLGTLYPRAFCARGQGDVDRMQTECMLQGKGPSLRVSVRFLQLLPSVETGARDSDAVERTIDAGPFLVADLARESVMVVYETPGDAGAAELAPTRARLQIAAVALAAELWRVRVVIENVGDLADGADRSVAQLSSLVSTHALLACEHGRFSSLLEPKPEHVEWSKNCTNVGAWPVLIDTPDDDVMLASPIILYDRPKIAPESPGDFFDATEIDEMLTLRVLTLAESERAEIRERGAPHVRALLERTEAVGEAALGTLHGARRDAQPAPSFARGDRVVLRPRKGGDVLDIALAGEAATVVGVEQDFEGRFHYMVTIDADPGADLGLTGQPGHRFFFASDELERRQA